MRVVLQPIVYADDCIRCPDCGEPWCAICCDHYAECDCIGPAEADDEGYFIVRVSGKRFVLRVGGEIVLEKEVIWNDNGEVVFERGENHGE